MRGSDPAIKIQVHTCPRPHVSVATSLSEATLHYCYAPLMLFRSWWDFLVRSVSCFFIAGKKHAHNITVAPDKMLFTFERSLFRKGQFFFQAEKYMTYIIPSISALRLELAYFFFLPFHALMQCSSKYDRWLLNIRLTKRDTCIQAWCIWMPLRGCSFTHNHWQSYFCWHIITHCIHHSLSFAARVSLSFSTVGPG